MRVIKHISQVTKEWINSVPKTINDNGCWIPNQKCGSDGYVKVTRLDLYLHRLALSLYYNIDYYDNKIATRHGPNCDRACFLYTHLTPGTNAQNEQDKVLHGRNYNSNKEVCPKCGGQYTIDIRKGGISKGQVKRYCRSCKRMRRLEREGKK